LGREIIPQSLAAAAKNKPQTQNPFLSPQKRIKHRKITKKLMNMMNLKNIMNTIILEIQKHQ